MRHFGKHFGGNRRSVMGVQIACHLIHPLELLCVVLSHCGKEHLGGKVRAKISDQMENVSFQYIHGGIVRVLIDVHDAKHDRGDGVVMDQILKYIVLVVKEGRMEFEFEGCGILCIDSFMKLVRINDQTVLLSTFKYLAAALDARAAAYNKMKFKMLVPMERKGICRIKANKNNSRICMAAYLVKVKIIHNITVNLCYKRTKKL